VVHSEEDQIRGSDKQTTIISLDYSLFLTIARTVTSNSIALDLRLPLEPLNRSLHRECTDLFAEYDRDPSTRNQ